MTCLAEMPRAAGPPRAIVASTVASGSALLCVHALVRMRRGACDAAAPRGRRVSPSWPPAASRLPRPFDPPANQCLCAAPVAAGTLSP
jgi:hypothetical protein